MTTALHPSSSPNERLMALAAFGRAMTREGVHPSDIAIVSSTLATPADDRAAIQAAMRRETENIALTRRVKAQEKALREAGREMEALRRRIAAVEAESATREATIADHALQIAAFESDVASRDRLIASLSIGGGR